jgi:hypothetical protein
MFNGSACRYFLDNPIFSIINNFNYKSWIKRSNICSSWTVFFYLFILYRTSELDEAEFSKYHSGVKRGDIVGICGYPGL